MPHLICFFMATTKRVTPYFSFMEHKGHGLFLGARSHDEREWRCEEEIGTWVLESWLSPILNRTQESYSNSN